MTFYIYFPKIPIDLAIAIINVLKSVDRLNDWDKIREYKDRLEFYYWIESIIKDNKVQSNKKDTGWWKAKIIGN